jgi:NAD+ kinase
MEKPIFRRIALMGRKDLDSLSETFLTLQDYLSTGGYELLVEEKTAYLAKETLPLVPANQLSQRADLLVVIGGDGSLLSAAHIAVDQYLPVLGINRGRLGFLTDIRPDEIEKIKPILEGHYQEESRFLLKATIQAEGQESIQDIALNDVVLLPGSAPKMIGFDIYINREFVCSQRADGVIVSTPTGSTAYALSGGGPILHPQLQAIVLVPMFPHTLSSRPIVVSADSIIEIVISERQEPSPFISCDGQKRIAVAPETVIRIEKYSGQLRLIHPEDYNYYDTLRKKLRWEMPTGNKP